MSVWDLSEVQANQPIKSAHVRNASNDWKGDCAANNHALTGLSLLSTTALTVNSVDVTGAWTGTWEPTVTPGSGSVSTTQAAGKFNVIGKTCFFRIIFVGQFTDDPFSITFSVPFTTADSQSVSSYVYDTGGVGNILSTTLIQTQSPPNTTVDIFYPGGEISTGFDVHIHVNGVVEIS